MTGASDTVDVREAAHFGAQAGEWWDPRGSSAMLHRINPARLRYIREQVDAHWGGDARSFTPLVGRTALDVGCGAGLLCEPLARMGAAVTGVDAAAESIAVARAHAEAGGLAIDYRVGDAGAVAGQRFDLVTSLEVVEHVTDARAFVRGLAEAVADGGVLIMSTPNRTALTRVALVGAAEASGMVPRGTHDWGKFLRPEQLTALIEDAGLRVTDVRGLTFSPARGFGLSGSTALDYFVAAVRG